MAHPLRLILQTSLYKFRAFLCFISIVVTAIISASTGSYRVVHPSPAIYAAVHVSILACLFINDAML